MFCPDCQQNLDAVAIGEPCPGCGGTRRSANAEAGVARVSVQAHNPGILLTKDDERPWIEKWQTTRDYRDLLADAYRDATGLGSRQIEGFATAFFTECDHLRDWLADDPSLPSISRRKVERYMHRCKPLEYCNAICNTHKHRQRRTKGPRRKWWQLWKKKYGPPLPAARVRQFERNADVGGATITIEMNWAQDDAFQLDALQLADQCLDCWRAFFATHGVTEPA